MQVSGIDHHVSCSWSSAEQNISFLKILQRLWLGLNPEHSLHQTSTLATEPMGLPRNCSRCNCTYVARLITSYPILWELIS
jgi:hypothetical protein